MPLYRLNQEIVFPHPSYAEGDGLLAIGGDLCSERIVLAYQNGIFPWYSEETEILWWSPDPRCVLYPEDLKVSKSMKQLFRQQKFEVTFNQDFEQVISNCKSVGRADQDGTWITDEMKSAYVNLHQKNIAHSVEVWNDKILVGGLYGILIGNVFFGESMFANESNASKYGFITWVNFLKEKGVKLIDCQQTTPHLLSLGAIEIPRDQFLNILQTNCY